MERLTYRDLPEPGIRLGPGTIVLNQNPDHPMSGEVLEPGEDHRAAVDDGLILVRWANGIVELESPADLTLTAALNWRLPHLAYPDYSAAEDVPGAEKDDPNYEIEPTCDICGEPEDHEIGLIEYDWNGETGNHLSCERRGESWL